MALQFCGLLGVVSCRSLKAFEKQRAYLSIVYSPGFVRFGLEFQAYCFGLRGSEVQGLRSEMTCLGSSSGLFSVSTLDGETLHRNHGNSSIV